MKEGDFFYLPFAVESAATVAVRRRKENMV